MTGQLTSSTPKTTHCAIEEALTVLGDRWTLLVVRDILRGVNRFDLLQESLGISRNILTQRLSNLEETGILTKSPVKPNAKRMLYNPTPKCMALIPVLITLIDWSSNWSEAKETQWSRVVDSKTKKPVTVAIVNQDQDPIPLGQLSIEF